MDLLNLMTVSVLFVLPYFYKWFLIRIYTLLRYPKFSSFDFPFSIATILYVVYIYNYHVI